MNLCSTYQQEISVSNDFSEVFPLLLLQDFHSKLSIFSFKSHEQNNLQLSDYGVHSAGRRRPWSFGLWLPVILYAVLPLSSFHPEDRSDTFLRHFGKPCKSIRRHNTWTQSLSTWKCWDSARYISLLIFPNTKQIRSSRASTSELSWKGPTLSGYRW